MWTKHIRFLVVSNIYSILYWDRYFDSIPDFETEDLILPLGLDYDDKQEVIDAARIYISKFHRERSAFTELLKKHLENWDKTSLLLVSVLYGYLLEKDNINQIGVDKVVQDVEADDYDHLFKKLTNQYIRLCDKYIDKSISSTLHAVILSIKL